MKVQLTVIQGKPQGKVIPLAIPKFRIGRGETCHLRPNSEQVSREHAEIQILADRVVVRDLGSRNGTFVNGTRIEGEVTLKDGETISVGPLTFLVGIQAVVASAPVAPQATASAPAAAPVPVPAKASDLENLKEDDIEAWLIADLANQTPESKSGVYKGDTQTFNALSPGELQDLSDPQAEAEPAAPAEWVDENNPFFQTKKAAQEPTKPTKPVYKDTSDAASDIIKRMMERKRASR
ncbi:FHA domain containing protein [Isosphaera pallida ATCC 43644]|uniref:FHA domain containing protein n=1 Tax=Isosphaera pallida (strain ATCC 43644 / DSM 9630 / IS1B) TaxID=575540 RepID=E8QYA7_ISOPI|nr:FHA domain-containing protein [Isosphaera pallida]ADV63102.1 FHA domain containing protein [Isosphaera pallida ATCC 43644]